MHTVTLIGLALIGLSLVRCSGGGGDPPVPASHAAQAPAPAPTPTPPPSTSQPDLLVATASGLWRGQATGQGGLILNRANMQQSQAVLSGASVEIGRAHV